MSETYRERLVRLTGLQHRRTVLAHMIDMVAAKYIGDEDSAEEMIVEGQCAEPVVPVAAIESVVDWMEQQLDTVEGSINEIMDEEVQEDGE